MNQHAVAAKTDEEIKRDVVNQLALNSRVDASDVNVDVSDGVVTLKGTVPTFNSRLAAFSSAMMIAGVRDVHNLLTVEYPGGIITYSDEEIRSNIQSVFSRSPDIDIDDVRVEVKDGIVVLEGAVPSFWQKGLAEDLAGNVSGVLDIQNHLAVVLPETALDKGVAESIVSTLERSDTVDPDTITVAVHEGVVTLSGVVDSWPARQTAYEIASYTPGVVGVRNNLMVESGG